MEITPLKRPQGDFLCSSNSLWPWQISLSDNNDCNWTGTVPSHGALSITLDTICCFHSCFCTCIYVCACSFVCVCLCMRMRVPVPLPLAAAGCAGNRELQCQSVCGIIKSSHHAVLGGSIVNARKRSAAVVAEPGAVITAAFKKILWLTKREVALTLWDAGLRSGEADWSGEIETVKR